MRPLTPIPGLLLLAAGLLATTARAAPDAPALRVAALAATCANCHGTNGRALDDSLVPGLAGQPAARLVEQLQGFKTGRLGATVMHQIAKGYTDAQIDTLAAYFAAQKR